MERNGADVKNDRNNRNMSTSYYPQYEDKHYDYVHKVWCGTNNVPLNGWHDFSDLTTASYCHFQNGLLHNKNGFAVISLRKSILLGVSSILFLYYLCGKNMASNISPQEWQEMVPIFEMIRIVEC